MADSYVCSKAKIKCSCGDKISILTVLPSRTIWLTGQPQANISDHKSMVNIAPFGKCHTTAYPATGSATAAAHGKLTPMPCVPNTPFPWMNGKNDVLLKGQPALLKSSSCKCVWGGTITFTYDGQVDGTGKDVDKENHQTQEELDASAEIELSAEDLLDGLQMALDAAGLFPGLGAIPDLLNACISACRGDWVNAGLCLFAAIPGIGDAAGAAKLMKNGAKMAQKTKKLKNYGKLEPMSESIAKGPNKDLAAARAKRLGVNKNEANYGSSLDTAQSNPQQRKFGELTAQNKTNAASTLPTNPQQTTPFGELTRRDRFEVDEAKAIDAIHKSEEPESLPPGMIKEPTTSTNNPLTGSARSDIKQITPEKVLKNNALNKPDVDLKPSPAEPKEIPVIGKKLDING